MLPPLLAALTDPEGEVRGSAAFALGQFSEYLQPDITRHYQQVLPGVFQLLRDPSADVQERACYGECRRAGLGALLFVTLVMLWADTLFKYEKSLLPMVHVEWSLDAPAFLLQRTAAVG